jgi:hypothetical protein
MTRHKSPNLLNTFSRSGEEGSDGSPSFPADQRYSTSVQVLKFDHPKLESEGDEHPTGSKR